MTEPYQTTRELLKTTLSAAVPLWIEYYRLQTPERRLRDIRRLQEDDFCLRMQYLLHPGPKRGDSAGSSNDLARALAIMSWCPGGVEAFGQHWRTVEDAQPELAMFRDLPEGL